jgi:hypothetical protein
MTVDVVFEVVVASLHAMSRPRLADSGNRSRAGTDSCVVERRTMVCELACRLRHVVFACRFCVRELEKKLLGRLVCACVDLELRDSCVSNRCQVRRSASRKRQLPFRPLVVRCFFKCCCCKCCKCFKCFALVWLHSTGQLTCQVMPSKTSTAGKRPRGGAVKEMRSTDAQGTFGHDDPWVKC